ncbi:hypothetical protein D3C86_1296860 [compost metagenome]
MDTLFALVGRDRNRPGEIGCFRIELVERRQLRHVAIDAHLADAREIAQQKCRLVALRIKRRMRLEGDLEGRHFHQRRGFVGKVRKRERDRLKAALIRRLGLHGFRCLYGDGSRRGCRNGFAVCQRFQFLHEATGAAFIDAAAVSCRIGQVRQHVGGAQHDFQNILGRLQLVGADAVEGRFKNVGESHEIIETEGTSPALDGMNGTENGVDGFRITVAVIQFKKPRFQFGELLLAFLEKDFLDFVHIHREMSRIRRLRVQWHR